MPSFKQLKLHRLDKAGVVLGSVDLVLPTAQRASRGRNPFVQAAGGAAAAAPQVKG